MNKKYILVIGLTFFLSMGELFSQKRIEPEPEREPIPMPTVNQDTLMKHIMELSSDSYTGRLAGSDGYNLAVRYVKKNMASYGLANIEEQPFTVECNEIENCKFNVYLPGDKDKRVFTLGNEFCCSGITGRGYVDAQMVFCGYGIDNSFFDEYKNVDVKGKVVVVLTGLPQAIRLPQAVVDHFTTLRDKARTAEKHGAIGMLAINISPTCPSYEPQGKTWSGELPHLSTFPILHLTLDCAREIFADQTLPIDSAISNIDNLRTPQSFSLLKKAEIDINTRYRPAAQTANVIGLLKGTEKLYQNEYIVVGASLDGVGMQGETCLFPGADINASGVAAVLETARLLSNSEYRPKRSILFVLFSGGEQQFLGSRTFVDFYPHLDRAEAFINVQNIGYGDSIVVLGDNKYPSLAKIAFDRDTLPGRLNITHPAERTNPRGDARAFDVVAIPSIVFTTHNGMHHNHTTTDMWENIDRRILTISSQIVVETVAELGEGLYRGRGNKRR